MAGDPDRFPASASELERAEWSNALANMRILNEANNETVEALVARAVFRRVPAKDLVIHATDPTENAHFLVAGVVRVFQEHGGVEYTAKLLTAPVHFGDLAIFAGLPEHQSSLEAVTECVEATIPAKLLEELLAKDPSLTRAWLYSVARQYVVTIDFLKQNVFGGVKARLSNVLLSYARAFGKEREEGWLTVGQELSYQTLARQAACTRRSAIGTMKEMSGECSVRNTDDGWEIQPDKLLAELLPGRLSLTHSPDDSRDPDEPV